MLKPYTDQDGETYYVEEAWIKARIELGEALEELTNPSATMVDCLQLED